LTPTDARHIIHALGMERHPEGGWYVQTFEDTAQFEGRAQSTAIYYLLEADEQSAWHRIDAIEVWHYYAGAPLALRLSDGQTQTDHVLGPDILSGQRPQVVVQHMEWQSARSLGSWTLVGCTVAPGFQFSGFELAPAGWEPGFSL
jgi:predicted cupin superfamily sugar epimerase